MRVPKKIIATGIAVGLTFSTLLVSPVIATEGSNTKVQMVPALYNNVKRIAGADRYETAVMISREGWPNTSDVAVLSAGMDENLADALTAAPLAKKFNAPILLTQGIQLNDSTKAELQRLHVKKVYITSGKGVITQDVHDLLIGMGIEPILLGGTDRFETSVNIAKQLNPDKVVVTTAWTNADALSVASIAAAMGMPILLTDKEELPDSIKSYITLMEDSIKQTYILGGEGAVSEQVKANLPNPSRIGGVDRYDTNLAILTTFAGVIQYKYSFLASGDDTHLVDALAGSPLAALTASPIVLSGNSLPESSKDYMLRNYPSAIIALGGEAVLTPNILNQFNPTLVYSTNGLVVGAPEGNLRDEIQDNILITANDFTLQNTNTKYSVLVQGENVTLKDVNVNGTIIANVKSNEKLTLKGVNANTLVVNSACQVVLENNSSIANIMTYAEAELNIDLSSQVKNLNTNGFDILISGAGAANVNLPGTGEVVGGIGGVIGTPQSNSVDDIIDEMWLNLSNGKTINFTIGKEVCTVNINQSGILDSDVVIDATIISNQDFTLFIDETILTDAVSTDLTAGESSLSLADLGIPLGEDGVQIRSLKNALKLGNSIRGEIRGEKGLVIPVKFQLLNK